MSIIIRFSISLKGFGRRWDRESARALIHQRALEKGCGIKEEPDDTTLFFLCPNGFISMRWILGRMAGNCRTDGLGAGFHAAVIDFLETLTGNCNLKLKLYDPTGYFFHRDFLKMRSEYFYRPFLEMMNRAGLKKDQDDPYFGWTTPFYKPEPLGGRRIADVRPFTDQEIKGIAGSGMSMAFAKDYYIWNDREKDVYFYRNGGLSLLNQSCYFKPSGRSGYDRQVNDAVIYYLEKALAIDPGIPFPKKEYLEVCGLAGHEPFDVSNVTALPEDLDIGCRKRTIYRTMSNTTFATPGDYLMDTESVNGMDHFYDGKKYGNHDFYIYGMEIRERGKAEFKENWFTQRPVMEEYRFHENGLLGRAVMYEPRFENGELVYTICGQVLNGFQRNNVMVCFRDLSEKDWALNLIKILKDAK